MQAHGSGLTRFSFFQFLTLVMVTSSLFGQTPTSAQLGECTAAANGPPTILAGQYGGLTVSAGSTVTTWVTLRDTTTTQDVFGNTKIGPDANTAQWDYSQLETAGASQFAASVSEVVGDNTSLKFQLLYHAPASIPQQQSLNIYLTVADSTGCQTRVTFPLTLTSGGGSIPPPTAVIRYDLGNGLLNRPANGIVPGVTVRSIQLDGAASQGTGLTYQWSLSPTSAGVLSSVSTSQSVLSVNASFTGNLGVTLAVTDQNQQQGMQTITFQMQASGGTTLFPTISYDTGEGAGWVGPLTNGQAGSTIHGSSLKVRANLVDESGEPTFGWTFSGQGVTATPETASQQEVAIQLSGGLKGTLSVALTVLSGDSSGSAYVSFPVDIVSPPETEITGFPGFVRVGEAFSVQGQANSSAGVPNFNFSWTTDPVNPVDPATWRSTPDSSTARIIAPGLETLDQGTLTVMLSAKQDGGQTATDQKQIVLLPSSLDFSQVAAGPFNAVGVCDDCRIETIVSLLFPTFAPPGTANQAGTSQTPASPPAYCAARFYQGDQGSSENPDLSGDATLDSQGRYVFEIPKGQSREYVVQSDSLWIGWLSLESSQPLVGHVFYDYIDQQGRVVAEIPVLPVRGRSFSTPLSQSVTDQVGLAVSNLSDEAAQFQVIVDDGVAVYTREIPIGPKGHFVMSLAQVYEQYSPNQAFPRGFLGGTLKLRLTSGQGPLALTLIRLDDRSLPLAILPVAIE